MFVILQHAQSFVQYSGKFEFLPQGSFLIYFLLRINMEHKAKYLLLITLKEGLLLNIFSEMREDKQYTRPSCYFQIICDQNCFFFFGFCFAVSNKCHKKLSWFYINRISKFFFTLGIWGVLEHDFIDAIQLHKSRVFVIYSFNHVTSQIVFYFTSI